MKIVDAPAIQKYFTRGLFYFGPRAGIMGSNRAPKNAGGYNPRDIINFECRDFLIYSNEFYEGS